MASKRKRVVLSLADKLKIIEQLDKGVTGKKLSEIYGVGKATISDIKNSKSTLLNFVSVLENEDGSSSRKTMKTATNKNLEDAVFKWFCSNVLWKSISGPILCEKAKILAEKLGYSSFKASNGWLRNFKFRHGVRELDLAGEKLSADSAAAENFIEKFKTASESYDPEFVYNADETGLVWKALPKTTLASIRESSAPGHKENQEIQEHLKRKKLPLFYKSQPKAWMTAALFTEWYDEVFIPEVKKHQNRWEKKAVRRQLLRKLLIEGAEDEELVLENHSKINLKDCCYMVAEAWSLVTAVTLRQVSAEDVGEWMACDTSDPGFQILNDDEIVVSVREDVEVEVEEELSADVEVDAGPSASEAFAGLETALKWMERQPECDHLQLLTVKRMRDLAARKRLKTAKQLTLTEMFKKQ
ncbi:hypothetical protein JTB14_035568 [Gonioctena quinquepunctata]|nr:hypothetical protein JTB14_035568 [Gonioctena quinquepunctata]